MHLISSDPSGLPEILHRDSKICGYLLPFGIWQYLGGQSCSLYLSYSPVLLETTVRPYQTWPVTAATGSLPSPRDASSHPSLPSRPLLPFSKTQDSCHCLVLQCQCSSLQSSPGRYCPSYLRHFWGGYLVLELVKQPRIGITCHVNILQNQPSVLSSSMKILSMPQKMWQKLN